LIQRKPWQLLNRYMYYIGIDIHKKAITYCIKDMGGQIPTARNNPSDSHRTGWLDEDSSSAMDGSDGSHDLHRLDL
jgi:hypothetical protein